MDFNGTMSCNKENGTSVSLTVWPKCLFLHYNLDEGYDLPQEVCNIISIIFNESLYAVSWWIDSLLVANVITDF